MALPSMIRVDATGRMDVIYDEVSEALGEEPGFFDAAEFEENMSTHYGRMIHEDDRTIMVANPEDAAEEHRVRPRRVEVAAASRKHSIRPFSSTRPFRRHSVREEWREVFRGG